MAGSEAGGSEASRLEDEIAKNLARQQMLIDKLTEKERERVAAGGSPRVSTVSKGTASVNGDEPTHQNGSFTSRTSPERSYRRSVSPALSSMSLHSGVRASPTAHRVLAELQQRDAVAAADLKALEMRELMADEQSVTLIRMQVAQIDQIRGECARKDIIIEDLGKQVRDLSAYKEEALTLKARNSVLDDRLTATEQELLRLKEEFVRCIADQVRRHEMTEHDLRSEIVELEKSRRTLLAKLGSEQEASANTAKSIREESSARIRELEGLLTEAKTVQKQAAERETHQIKRNSDLTAQLATITEQRNTAEKEYADLGLQFEAQAAEVQELRMKLSNEQAMYNKLKTELGETRAELTEARIDLDRMATEAEENAAEYAALKEREEIDRMERDKFARARMELIGLRNEAHQQLHSALDRSIPHSPAHSDAK